MASGLIVILAALIPFILDVVQRKMVTDANPLVELTKANEKVDLAISKHDGTAITLMLNDALDQLHNRQGSAS